MILENTPKMSVSSLMGYLKGKRSLMLYEQFGDLKCKYRNREFWCRGYYCLLYTYDAADELYGVDRGARRINKQKKTHAA